MWSMSRWWCRIGWTSKEKSITRKIQNMKDLHWQTFFSWLCLPLSWKLQTLLEWPHSSICTATRRATMNSKVGRKWKLLPWRSGLLTIDQVGFGTTCPQAWVSEISLLKIPQTLKIGRIGSRRIKWSSLWHGFSMNAGETTRTDGITTKRRCSFGIIMMRTGTCSNILKKSSGWLNRWPILSQVVGRGQVSWNVKNSSAWRKQRIFSGTRLAMLKAWQNSIQILLPRTFLWKQALLWLTLGVVTDPWRKGRTSWIPVEYLHLWQSGIEESKKSCACLQELGASVSLCNSRNKNQIFLLLQALRKSFEAGSEMSVCCSDRIVPFVFAFVFGKISLNLRSWAIQWIELTVVIASDSICFIVQVILCHIGLVGSLIQTKLSVRAFIIRFLGVPENSWMKQTETLVSFDCCFILQVVEGLPFRSDSQPCETSQWKNYDAQ